VTSERSLPQVRDIDAGVDARLPGRRHGLGPRAPELQFLGRGRYRVQSTVGFEDAFDRCFGVIDVDIENGRWFDRRCEQVGGHVAEQDAGGRDLRGPHRDSRDGDKTLQELMG